jgi:glutathione S-transferase
MQGTGATQVPCLRITEADGQTRWLQDSAAIVAYLRKRFA